VIAKDKVVLITGCGGMLGAEVYQRFRDQCVVVATDVRVDEPWLTLLDVTRPEQVSEAFERIKPDYVIHLAALTDLEYCEQNPHEAYEVNTWGTRNVAECADRRGIPIVSMSTAGVFDGGQSQYCEEDVARPLSVYGKSKYAGDLVVGRLEKGIILRAGWMMGGGPAKDKKFVGKILRQLRAGSRQLTVVDDKFGSPCYAGDVANAIYYLLPNGGHGLFHGASDGGGASRFEVAEVILEALGLREQIELRRVDSGFFQSEYFAPRPVSEQLSNRKLKQLNPKLVRDWRTCLREYLSRPEWSL
jgi:dTDP-4-dehydrorhamnose reductase